MSRHNSTKKQLSAHRHSGGNLLFHLGALFTVGVWGFSFISTSVLLDKGLGPVVIYVLRFLLAYIILFLIDHRKLFANNWRDEMVLLLCGVTSGSIYYITENSALEYTSAANVALITALAPLLTTMLVGFLYKNERPSVGTWIGSTIAFIGVGCIIINDDFDSSQSISGIIGDMLALASALSWAIYSILLRRISASYSTTFITRKTLFYGVLTALPFLLIEPELPCLSQLLQPSVFSNLIFLGVVASLMCFFLWSTSVKRLGAITTSNYLYFSPVITIIAAWLILDDNITVLAFIGCGLVIGGLALGDYLTEHINRANGRH